MSSLLVLAAGLLHAADWPAYRGDNSRSGSTPETLSFPLFRAWTNQPSPPPAPTWPQPARGSLWQRLSQIEPRSTEDRAFHPIVVGQHLFLSSSSDDQVRSLNLLSGALEWRFFTEGPVRYAPAVYKGRLLVGSDDGFVYCLNATNGALLWKSLVGPEDRRIPGNGRLISLWPIRTGVLVQNETVFCFAGLFPSQGVYSAALRIDDGSRIYREPIDQSPQGYLLSAGEGGDLYAPTGRSTPIAIDPANGRFRKQFTGVGGTFALVIDDELVAGRGNAGSLVVSKQSSRVRVASFPGRQMVVDGARSYLLYTSELVAIDRQSFRTLTAEKRQLEERLSRARVQAKQSKSTDAANEVSALASKLETIEQQLTACELWKLATPGAESLLLAGTHIFVGGSNRVDAFNAATGQRVWGSPIAGKAMSLAAANGHLIVSTDSGRFETFRSSDVQSVLAASSTTTPPPSDTAYEPEEPRDTSVPTPTASSLPTLDPQRASVVDRVSKTPQAKQGYGLLLGSPNLTLAKALVAQTQLQITLVQTNASLARQWRETLVREGLYGARLNVLISQGSKLPFTDRFANLVVHESTDLASSSPWSDAEIQRVLRPYGSLAWLRLDAAPWVSPALPGAADWTHLYGNPANTASTADTHITPRLELQWFGGPGPRAMTDRHLRGPAPLVTQGRMFIMGEEVLIGVDAFNGTQLWMTETPGSRRYSIPYDSSQVCADANAVYVALQQEAWQIDATSGEVLRRQRIPETAGSAGAHWGFLAIDQGRWFGSTQKPGASRREPTYEAIDKAYTSRQPMVTSQSLFSLQPGSPNPEWTYNAPAIINATITISDGKVYFFESRQEGLVSHPTGRITLAELTSTPLHLVALDARSGRRLWDRAMDLRLCENILYLAAAQDHLVVVGSNDSPQKDARYQIFVLDSANGTERWNATHDQGKPGELYHGEQVHHPVILQDILVVEPKMYELTTGRPHNPEGREGHWPIVRPGHSCGTMTGAGRSLFFRANNPTVLSLETGQTASSASRFTRLAPSRPGCWISMIPANGLVLLPEASAGCECDYSLQTSMAFRPRP